MNQTQRYFFKIEIDKIKKALLEFKQQGVQDGWVKHPFDLYFSDHLTQRIVERRLQKDISFISALTKHFMLNVFYQTTYNRREYIIELRGLKVGVMIDTGLQTGLRYAAVTTAFENSVEYKCDEVIRLK